MAALVYEMEGQMLTRLRRVAFAATITAFLLAPGLGHAQHESEEDEEGGITKCNNSHNSCNCHRNHEPWIGECWNKHNTRTTGVCGNTGGCVYHYGYGDCYSEDLE